jgi:hypothetical protein
MCTWPSGGYLFQIADLYVIDADNSRIARLGKLMISSDCAACLPSLKESMQTAAAGHLCSSSQLAVAGCPKQVALGWCLACFI